MTTKAWHWPAQVLPSVDTSIGIVLTFASVTAVVWLSLRFLFL